MINFKCIKVWHVIIMWIITLFCLCSCGARKTDVSKTETTVTGNIETNIKKTEVVTVNDKDQTTTTEETIEPVDATKEAVYIDKKGIKQILHNAKKKSVTTIRNNNTKTEMARNENVGHVEQKAVVAKTKEKHIDKKQFNPFQLLWLLIPLGVIWWAYRKYKNLPFVPKL